MFGRILSEAGVRGELNQALSLGMNFAVGMAVFSFIGFYIDQRRGDDRILFTIIGMVMGLAYGAYEVWKVIRILNRQATDACRPPAPKPSTDKDDGSPGGSGASPS